MSLKFRKAEEIFFKVVMKAATIIILISLASILYTILVKGITYLNLDMITRIPEGGFYIGKGGGILNAIIGSLYIAGGATFLGLIISIPIVMYLHLYLVKGSATLNFIRTCFDVLFGIPSIVYGAFGFTLMVYLGLKTSLLAGILTVTLLIIPILVRSIDEVMILISPELKDALFALGATRWEASKVLLRQAAPGVFTAILLSFGRAIGDAACPLFTAGYTDNIPTSLSQPTATLPLAIFFQLSSPIEEVQGRAYAAALILTILILIINVMIRIVNKRLGKHKI
jgi:phosphate transport system permease protein